MRGLLIAASVLLIANASAALAGAHHGFNGRYDRSKPLWIAGTITQATYNQPHALITIEPAPPAAPPADLLALTADAYSRLGGHDVVGRSQPIAATGGGVLVLLLNPVMTDDVARRGAPPPGRGQTVGAIVFRECSTGELRVQLLRLSASDVVVRDSARQREVDGCDVATPAATAPPTVAVAPIDRPGSVEVETEDRADGGTVALIAGAVVLAGALGLGVGLLLARRAR
jgi:hypothetical protein